PGPAHDCHRAASPAKTSPEGTRPVATACTTAARRRSRARRQRPLPWPSGSTPAGAGHGGHARGAPSAPAGAALPGRRAMDLAVRNGTVVTSAAVFPADVGVDGGRIVQVGGTVPAAARELDATGKLVLPGCVDIHTHLASRPTWRPLDDFGSGTRAA